MSSANTFQNSSNIINFLKSARIFITGGTGFLGSVLIEKILRTCPHVQQIYFLSRSKQGVNINERHKKFLEKPVFDNLRKTQPDFKKKIILISGDVTLTNLGMEENDLEMIIVNVNCIINCAANVRFTASLRMAAYTNVSSILELVKLAKKIQNLKSFLHVSTAFSCCHLSRIDEEFYEPPILAEKFLNFIANSNDEHLEKQTPKLLGKFPNSYVFTKAIAEDYLKREATGLPVVILRPAIIQGSYQEPTPGWIDNVNGPVGTFLAISLGILTRCPINSKAFAELVPVDYVANCGIALLASVATKTNHNQIKIYNFVSSPSQSITWGTYYFTSENHYLTFPSVKSLWSINFKMIESLVYYHISDFFFNRIRGKIFDTILYLMGQKPFVAKTCKKLKKSALAVQPILLNTIVFTNDNVKELWSSLNETDRKLFAFDMRNFDWNSYLCNYVKGIRLYLLNDPMETVDAGLKKYKRLKTIDRVLKQIFGLVIILSLGYLVLF